VISSKKVVTSSRSARSFPFLITLLILWLATGLRFYQIDVQSFWNDEGNSARLSERSLPLIIEGTASDIHPPLYYLFLRGWRELLGENEFGLRSFSAFAGILTVAASLSLARLLFKQASHKKRVVYLALMASFLAAVNPALVYYSRETRMYALLALLSALSTLALLRWLNAERRLPWTIFYVILAVAGLYTHYFFPAILILHNLIVILWSIHYFAKIMFEPRQFSHEISLRNTILNWASMMALIFLLYLPWLPIFLRQIGGRLGEQGSFQTFIWESVRWLAYGETIASGELFWSTVAVFLLCFWAVIVGRGKSVIPLLGTFVPITFMFISGATLPAQI